MGFIGVKTDDIAFYIYLFTGIDVKVKWATAKALYHNFKTKFNGDKP
jgi:hypothetical protein